MFESYKNRMALRGHSVGDILRKQANMVMEQTWDRDPNARKVYVIKVNHGLPAITSACELIDVKFNIKTYQSITADEVAYMLQFRHGEEKRHPEITIGSYIYMEDEDGEWKWWLIVHLDERPQFRQYQILECNWTFGWVVGGTVYHCLGVQRVQQSYNSGSWDGDRFTFVDNITSAWLPTNSDTLTIGYNQRFIISDSKRYPPLVWITSKIEDTQPEGLTKLKFTQETFNPKTDNEELMLADYYSSNITPNALDTEVDSQSKATITYNGATSTVRIGGNFKTFTAVFSNKDVVAASWYVSDGDGDVMNDTENYTIECENNTLKLKVAQNYKLIDKVLIVQVIGTDKSTAEVSVEVVG